jgi:hypothetical protein
MKEYMLKQLRYDQCLTNEMLGKQGQSQFALVGRAIAIAEYLVKSGKAATDWPDNISNEVLRRMSEEGVDQLEHEVFTEDK